MQTGRAWSTHAFRRQRARQKLNACLGLIKLQSSMLAAAGLSTDVDQVHEGHGFDLETEKEKVHEMEVNNVKIDYHHVFVMGTSPTLAACDMECSWCGLHTFGEPVKLIANSYGNCLDEAQSVAGAAVGSIFGEEVGSQSHHERHLRDDTESEAGGSIHVEEFGLPPHHDDHLFFGMESEAGGSVHGEGFGVPPLHEDYSLNDMESEAGGSVGGPQTNHWLAAESLKPSFEAMAKQSYPLLGHGLALSSWKQLLVGRVTALGYVEEDLAAEDDHVADDRENCAGLSSKQSTAAAKKRKKQRERREKKRQCDANGVSKDEQKNEQKNEVDCGKDEKMKAAKLVVPCAGIRRSNKAAGHSAMPILPDGHGVFVYR